MNVELIASQALEKIHRQIDEVCELEMRLIDSWLKTQLLKSEDAYNLQLKYGANGQFLYAMKYKRIKYIPPTIEEIEKALYPITPDEAYPAYKKGELIFGGITFYDPDGKPVRQ